MSKRFLITLVTLLVVISVATLAVYLAKGYTFSSKDGKLVGTGIISVSSAPDGASVYIDGHLATATNTTISQLSPKKYSIKIIKEGFIPWEKSVEVKQGLVSEIKATLFPALPTIYPLTYNGAVSPIMSPDGSKLAFAVPVVNDSHARQKGGIWVWTFTSQPISFNRSAEPHQIVTSASSLDFSKAQLRWSPDSKQVLVTLQEGGVEGEASQRNYLLAADRQTSLSDLRDITPQVDSFLKGWEEDQKAKDEARVLAIQNVQVRQVASSSATVMWSPDETKFIAAPSVVLKSANNEGSLVNANNKKSETNSTRQLADQNDKQSLLKGFKIYDFTLGQVSTQEKNSSGGVASINTSQVKEYTLPEALAYHWLPDSKHIILINQDKISVMEFDGTNEAVIYGGAFNNEVGVFPWPDSSKLVVLTSFNTPTASNPNLFGINLK